MLDSHCHIDLYDDPLSVATEAERASIDVVAVSYLPSHYEMAKRHLTGFRHVRPALGLHPLAWKDHHREVGKFVALVKETTLIGEIGLDFSEVGKSGKAVQERSFSEILPHLADGGRFITLHSRGAENEVLSQLTTHKIQSVVFHWFSGSKSQLTRILDAGHAISINTAMIQTSKWPTLVRFAPRNRVLTETDGPFVCRGKIPDKPTSVWRIIQWLAEAWSCSPQEAESQIQQNFKLLSGAIS